MKKLTFIFITSVSIELRTSNAQYYSIRIIKFRIAIVTHTIMYTALKQRNHSKINVC